jgi:parvulin-like peptidyl-prolyl isomerase
LSTLIQWSITEQAAADQFSYDPTEDEVQDRIDELVSDAGAEDLNALVGSTDVPEEVLRRYVRQLMIQDEVSAQLEATVDQPTDEDVAAELADNPATWTFVCVSHLLVETEDAASAALARVEAGEDFAVVASEVSTDTASAANGGDLGCTTAAAYVPGFSEATMESELGVVVGPVESQFGFHALVVNEREIATAEDVRATIVGEALREATDAWFLTAANDADVTIDERFGTWTTQPAPAVLPPPA